MKTRTKTSVPVKQAIPSITPKQLPAQDAHPPKLFILPYSLSKDASIISLPHPRTLKSTRYYHCKQTGFYEIKRITSNGSKRSLLLAPCGSVAEQDDGHVIQTAAVFAVTPMDPLFLLLPALSPAPKGSREVKSMFLSLDDHIDALGDISGHLQHVCRHEETLRLIERRLALICDVVAAGEENMYRLDHGKLLKHLLAKAETMVKAGLPASMEAHFVKKPLQIPGAHFLDEGEEQKKSVPPVTEAADVPDESQATTISTATSTSSLASQSTTITVPEGDSTSTTPHSIIHSLRLRVALNFLFASYIPAHLAEALEKLLAQAGSPIDFAPLTAHLAHLTKLRAELSAQARETMMGDSRKRGLDDEEAAAEREEKKLKREEEERRRKAGESRGVRDLKKVNVKGMKKMSDFFGKKS